MITSKTTGPALVTVGMPVFNGEQWINDSITSLLGQTFTAFDLVISDNASTDGTRAICERFATRDARVRYFRNPENIGLFRNYDRAFELSSTKYFKWAAAGDICRPTLLEKCVAVLENRPDVVLAYARTALFDERTDDAQDYEDGLDLQDDSPSARFGKLIARIKLNNVMNGVVRSEALRRTALNRVYASSDINLVAELCLDGKFVEVPESLFLRRMTKATATALKSRDEKAQYFRHEPKNVYEMRRWKFEAGFLVGLWHARISSKEKLRVLSLLVGRLRSGRAKLLVEFVDLFRRKARN